MYLLHQGQINIENLFTYELAPLPTSLCKDSGQARYTQNKSVLKTKLKYHPEV